MRSSVTVNKTCEAAMSVERWYEGQLAHPQHVGLPAQVCCRPLSRLICAIKRVEILALFWSKHYLHVEYGC